MTLKRANVMERRQLAGEMRTIEDQGIVTSYLTKWGTVDSYNTTFAKGSFKKTFQERGHKVRVLYNHEELAGKILDFGEDDIGPWAKVQFNLDTRTGSDTFAHIKAGDIDCFSFGFNRIQSRPKGDVVEITEVRLWEVSPVIFEANSEAIITDSRAEDFDSTLNQKVTSSLGYQMLISLEDTLSDIKWNNDNPEDITSKVDVAISDFHLAYMQWLSDFFMVFERSNNLDEAIEELRKTDNENNEIKREMRNHDSEELVRTTSLTEDEIKTLCSGDLLNFDTRKKLTELPESIGKAHQIKRNKVVSTLCDELRFSGFSSLERLRFTSLLGISEKKEVNTDGKTLIETIDSWKL